MDEKKKKCRTCGDLKDFSEFHPEKGGKFGLRGSCILCFRKRQNGHNAEKRAKRLAELARQRPDLLKVFDEKGVEVTPDQLGDPRYATALALGAGLLGQEKVLAHNYPELATPDFAGQLKASATVMAQRLPTTSCSCCRLHQGENRGSYLICRRCAVSVDVCGRCILHHSQTFRPELQMNTAPTEQQVLEALGESRQALPPPLFGPEGPPPEDDY